MTVSSEIATVDGAGNGSATVFSFSPMVVHASTDLEVYHYTSAGVETLLTEGSGASNYSVTVTSYPGTGSVTYPADEVTPMASGEKIVIRRDIPLTQTLDLPNNGGWFPTDVETRLDLLTRQIQDVDEAVSRALTLPASGDTDVVAGSYTLTSLTVDAKGRISDISSGTSPLPFSDFQLHDTSADHQYVFTVNELSADRNVDMPLLTADDVFVFEAHAATLTNKTIALGSNTISGTLAQFNTAVTDASLVSLAGSETLTNKTLTAPTINGVVGGTQTSATITTLTSTSVNSATIAATGLSSLANIDMGNAANPTLVGNDTNGEMSISAGATNILGAGIRLFGDTHASQADDIEFVSTGSTVELHFDDSGDLWDFQGNAMTTTGAVTGGAGSFSTLALSGDITFSQADPEVMGADTNGTLILGANTNALGSVVKLYGDTHATKAGDFEFLDDTTVVLHYDASAAQLEVIGQLQVGNATDGVILDNASGAYVGNSVYVRRNSSSGDMFIVAGTSIARNMYFGTGASGATTMTLAATSGDLTVVGAISGSSLTLTTDLAVTEGGTGASTASAARTNLGVAIGSDVQGWDADLDALAALAATAGMVSRTGAGAFAVRTITGTANEISVANGDGSAGAPTLSFPSTVSFSGKTISDLGTVTTANIDGGTVDSTVIGGTSAAAITGTTVTASTELRSTALDTNGATDLTFRNSAGDTLILKHNALPVNWLEATPGASGQAFTVGVASASGNHDLDLKGSNAGVVSLYADGAKQLTTGGTSSSVNYWVATGSATATSAVLSVDGTDANIVAAIEGKGSSPVHIGTNFSRYFIITGSTGTSNIKTSDGHMELLAQGGGTAAGLGGGGGLVMRAGALNGATKAIEIQNATTAPTSSATDAVLLYAEDVTASSELKVRDEAGNVTTLSPHNFSMVPGGRSEEMAFGYYSERDGNAINVDMLAVVREVEKLSGKPLVHLKLGS